MNKLTLDDFELFAQVAARQSLSAVARERNVVASQVSRALARIEAACAARLMHRSTHGLALTPEGNTFLDYCIRITSTSDFKIASSPTTQMTSSITVPIDTESESEELAELA